MAVATLALAAPAFGQHTPTLVTLAADQSWMINPGNRGPGPIDHGTLLSASVLWRAPAGFGVEVAWSGLDIRPRNLDTGRFYEGRIQQWIGFHLQYFVRESASGGRSRRVEPFIGLGAGVLKGQQRYFLDRINRVDVSSEYGFPLFVGGGALVFLTRHVALRTDLRFHLSGEESIVRGLIGVGYLF
jgi:hypothetical protein